jgi:hypothetical protein
MARRGRGGRDERLGLVAIFGVGDGDRRLEDLCHCTWARSVDKSMRACLAFPSAAMHAPIRSSCTSNHNLFEIIRKKESFSQCLTSILVVLPCRLSYRLFFMVGNTTKILSFKKLSMPPFGI